MVGGWVLATSIPVKHIFALLAIFPAIFAVCIYLVGKAQSRMLGREAISVEAEPSHAST